MALSPKYERNSTPRVSWSRTGVRCAAAAAGSGRAARRTGARATPGRSLRGRGPDALRARRSPRGSAGARPASVDIRSGTSTVFPLARPDAQAEVVLAVGQRHAPEPQTRRAAAAGCLERTGLDGGRSPSALVFLPRATSVTDTASWPSTEPGHLDDVVGDRDPLGRGADRSLVDHEVAAQRPLHGQDAAGHRRLVGLGRQGQRVDVPVLQDRFDAPAELLRRGRSGTLGSATRNVVPCGPCSTRLAARRDRDTTPRPA